MTKYAINWQKLEDLSLPDKSSPEYESIRASQRRQDHARWEFFKKRCDDIDTKK